MIDNVKLFVLDKHSFENHIVKGKVIDLNTKFNQMTGEVEDYPKRGKDGNLNVGITLNTACILGSIHKYHNIMMDRGNQNFDDFYYSQIETEIRGLIKKYSIENDTSITNLEFGFNLAVEKDPQIILDNNILMNNFKAPNKNLKFLGKGDYKEFQMSDYSIKIYNKSKQFKLKSNVMRVELKITKKRFLQLLGVYELEDLLDKNILELIYSRFMELFEGLIIIDCFSPEIIPENDYNKLNKYTNPSYWIRIKSEKSPRVISRLKKDFFILLNKYELLKTKNQIREKLNNKFFELIQIDTYKNVA
jgi:hypothetical protein